MADNLSDKLGLGIDVGCASCKHDLSGGLIRQGWGLHRYTLQDMREFGRKKGWCPYFTARHMLAFANVMVYNYQYMLDPKASTAAYHALATNLCREYIFMIASI